MNRTFQWQTKMWTEEEELFDSIENISDFGLLRFAAEFAWCENSKNLEKNVAKRPLQLCIDIIPCKILQAEKQNKINLNCKCDVTVLPCFHNKNLLEWNVETTGATPSIWKMPAARQIVGARMVRF
ncbi:hypothetical protein Y032_0264g625 [Ancylostoma ceylanicum]|uniref:Uncharacterized protein n=1 Tax=Ancylostoma ceylanicum TaxID=53326 RepID=A0A016SAI9_9BILA|nr:hypothetical protein Y032_0264g625 [Ancylostoma ceylanicum]